MFTTATTYQIPQMGSGKVKMYHKDEELILGNSHFIRRDRELILGNPRFIRRDRELFLGNPRLKNETTFWYFLCIFSSRTRDLKVLFYL